MASVPTPWARAAVELLVRSWRLEVVGDQHVQRLRQAGVPIVFTVWHAHLLAPLWHRRQEGITLLVSQHADGGYLAQAARDWGYRVVRGSSTRGGVGGLLAVIRSLAKGGDVAVTPDGPRGPARTVKPGALAAAARVGAAVVPVGAGASSWWQLRSWDGFAIPRPFARVRVVYGAPLRAGLARKHGDLNVDALTRRLDAAQERAVC